MSFVDMQRTSYNLVTKGKFFGYQIDILLTIDKLELDYLLYFLLQKILLYFLFIKTTI